MRLKALPVYAAITRTCLMTAGGEVQKKPLRCESDTTSLFPRSRSWLEGRKTAEGEPKPEEVTMELVDGALSLTQEGDETMVLKLTDAGELVMEIGFVSLYFVPAPVAAE